MIFGRENNLPTPFPEEERMIRIVHYNHNIEDRIVIDLDTRTRALRHIKGLLSINIPIDHIMVFEIGVYSNGTYSAKEYLEILKQ